LLEFGQIAVRQVKSNSVVIVGSTPDGSLRLLGMGAGQPNRVVSTKLAIDRARATLAAEAKDEANVGAFVRENLGQALLLSEAFFPFPDSVDAAAEAGIRTIVQPGGSIRDDLVVARCDELAITMITTGMRHFKH
jgi:phosphoribosylaminoimidazolecarboxamide formyltransferase / IMP cyclohydrolase